MLRALFVAEKNDVAKGISGLLANGHFNRREGRSKFNKIYELQTQVLGRNAVVSITSVSGHMMELAFHADMANWQTVRIASLFDAPVQQKVADGMKDIARTLTEEAKKNDVLVIWTDCDREGENIGAEIVKVCKESNPRLDVFRAKFSEITASAVHRAVRNLVRLDNNIVDAVDCRSELDLRIGAAFTRLQTLHLRSKFRDIFESQNQKVISYGSCQFPTLGFVVDRYKMIENFKPENFWRLLVEHVRNGIKVDFLWDRNRLFDRDVVNVLYDNCQEKLEAIVEKVVKKPKSRWRPYAMDTVALEKLGSSKLKMSAKEVMSVAEKLYSKGWISYPRTETNKFPKGMELAPLVEMQAESNEWGNFAKEVVERGVNPRNGNKSDEAHPPIHPLKFADRQTLNGNEWRVYELVVRHFLACVSRDASGEETVVNLRINSERFHANGLCVKDLGYMHVYVYEKWGDKQIPTYVENEILKEFNLRIVDGTTQPPDLLTEADLIALMDKFGIGTDATHAEHIEKIKERDYIGVKGDGKLLPSFIGLALVDGYDDMGFAMSKPDLRANLERGLKDICDRNRNKRDVLTEQIGKYRTIFDETESKVFFLSKSLEKYLDKRSSGNLPDVGNGGHGGGPPRGPDGGGGRGAPRGGGADRGRGRGGRKTTASRRGRKNDMAASGANMSNYNGEDEAETRRPRERKNTRTLAEDAEEVMCACNPPLQAVQKTVQKEGPNKGKRFWTCSLPFNSSEKCSFFQWV
ncbi:unnamed protein product [Caenorhabditis auriculariae]|uniref:DNA topoisomerase n=1 Tax=Caenorhabditis auriculariae TaxID=2777116 RepID=A0A8S1GYW3_9PELO|nr:unnamed protein product [Caenorhabditis auriculariae]